MKKYLICITVILWFFGALACEEENKVDFEGKNEIYLSIEGDPVLSETDENALIVQVNLTKTCSQDVELTFGLTDDPNNVLSLSPASVIIKAGTKKAFFEVVSNNKDRLIEEQYIGIKILSMPSNDFELKSDLKIRVKPNPKVSPLTEEQKALLEGYKKKYGIDLSDWLGIVSCQVTIQSPANGSPQVFEEAFTKKIEGKTVITLSEQSTPEEPVLKMIDNPLGLTEYLYWVLRMQTVENYEYWNHPDLADNQKFMKIINWNPKSTEEFSMTLDQLKLKNIESNTATVDFVGIKTDSFDDQYNVIAFDYSFSAWKRQKELLDKGDAEMKELFTYDISANPETYLFISNIDNDSWEDPKNFVSPTANIDFAKGTMDFNFVFDHKNAGGYSIITVNYTKEK